MPTKQDVENELVKERADRAAAEEESEQLGLRVAELMALLHVGDDEKSDRVELVPCPEFGAPGPAVEMWKDPEAVKFVAEALQPFPPDQVGKLPRSSCRDCSNYKPCSRHEMVWKCKACGQNHPSSTIHLDYVGHAELTSRLLNLDPGWNWEPVEWDADGLPKIIYGESQCVMWIRLTVRGVTRLGVGTAPRSKEEIHKELIGDALRNAGMRFGLALDLWSKSDRMDGSFGLEAPAPVAAPAPAPAPAPQQEAAPPAESAPADDPGPPQSVPEESAPAPAQEPPKAQEGNTAGLSFDQIREQVVNSAFLRLKGADAKAARSVLEDGGFWPILDVKDEDLETVASLLAPIIEGAVSAGRAK